MKQIIDKWGLKMINNYSCYRDRGCPVLCDVKNVDAPDFTNSNTVLGNDFLQIYRATGRGKGVLTIRATGPFPPPTPPGPLTVRIIQTDDTEIDVFLRLDATKTIDFQNARTIIVINPKNEDVTLDYVLCVVKY